MKILLSLLLAFFYFTASPYALAQDDFESQIFIPPASVYTNEGEVVRRIQREASRAQSGKIKAGTVQVELVHHSYMEPEQFGILMTLPDSVTGCFELSPLEYEAKFVGDIYMDIKVKDYVRKTTKTKDVAFDCDKKTKLVSGLIVLNAKDLREKGVREIRFNNGSSRDTYKVTYQNDSIELQPESMTAFKAKGLTGADKNKLVYYFSDQNLIALQVPMANKGEDIAQRVRNLAYQSALQPVFQKDGIDTSGDDNIFYFLDPNGRILSLLNESGYMELGTINAPRPYDGPQGRQAVATPLKVFATRPDTKL